MSNADSFDKKTIAKGPKRSSTRIREAFFTEFAEKVQALNPPIPIQLSGGFRSRTGMADAIESSVCQMIGLGRAVVLEPTLPASVLLNPAISDEAAVALPHIVRGQWFARLIPVKVIGGGLAIQFFYHQMRRMGRGLQSSPDMSILGVIVADVLETVRAGLKSTAQRLLQSLPLFRSDVKID